MRSSPSGSGSRSGAPPKGRGAPKADPAGAPVAGEIYFEFIPAGAYIKVVAIDADTGVEVSIVGARAADQATLERAALAKLRYVLENIKR
jgi:hypothetical protein